MSISIAFTGRNGADVRDWANAHAPEGTSWFVTKGMAASTGMQAWRFVAAGQEWPEGVRAAVYDPGADEWLPVWPGDTVVQFAAAQPIRHRVLRPVGSDR